MPWPLEPSGAELRAMVRDVLDRLVPWIERMPDEPVARTAGGRRLAASLRRPFPEAATPWRGVLGVLERARTKSLNTTHPGYLAYVPGGGIPDAAVADLYADLVNRYTGLWIGAPGFVQLEMDVIRWFCEMVGFSEGPEGSGRPTPERSEGGGCIASAPADAKAGARQQGAGGLLTTGGSLANLAAVVAARRRLGPDFLDGVLYLTEQSHHSIKKAAFVAGFSERNLRLVPMDAAFRMDPDALVAQIAADRAAGLRPLLVAAAAGSTAVGAVDPLPALRAAAPDLWLHVDAAYGGFFALTARGRDALAGIELADSVALDPHKGLFLPYGTGCVLVRRREDLRAAHAVSSAYLPAVKDDPDAWDFADLGPELSRDARGLRVWLPLVRHGFGAFREALDEKLDLARAAADGIRALPDVRMITEPVLSLFAFRAEPAGEADLDAYNRRWLSRVNQRERVFLTGATVADPKDGRPIFVLRVCVLSFRTHAPTIDALLADLADSC